MGFNKSSEVKNSDLVELTETFYINNKKNIIFQVTLSDKGFCLKKNTGGTVKEQVIKINDIIGCRCTRSKKKTRGNIRACACSSPKLNSGSVVSEEYNPDIDTCDSSAYLHIYAYILKKGLRSQMRRERTVLTLRFRSFDKYEENIREAQKWQNTIYRLKNDENPDTIYNTQGKLLILLNPKSGAGKARELFHQEVAPVLVEADLGYDLYVTKHANFAKDFVRTKDLSQWRGILVVGGDGILWEVLNGLMQRSNWKEIFQRLPIGIVPCGSGNGLAKSISHLFNEPYEPKPILSAALTAVRGRTSIMDLVRVETRSQIMYSFLSVGWGLISDIDIESERLRSIGYQRFTVWSIHRLIRLRTYHGKLSYLPQTNEVELSTKNVLNKTANGLKHSVSMDTCFTKPDTSDFSESGDSGEFGDVISLETSKNQDDFRQRNDSWYSATSRKSTYFSIAASSYQSVEPHVSEESAESDIENISQTFGPSSNIPSLMSPVPSTWNTEEGDFVMVHAAYQSHLGTDCHFAPSAKLNDGVIWLVIIRGGVSRSQLLNFLLNMSSGTHIPRKENEFIQIIPVSAFRIEPTGSEGIITVDGERVEYGLIQGEIFPGLVNIMVP